MCRYLTTVVTIIVVVCVIIFSVQELHNKKAQEAQILYKKLVIFC
jgi:hypothetical protein